MKTEQIEILAKGLAQGMAPRLKEINSELTDVLALLEDLQDRVRALELPLPEQGDR